MIPRHSERFFEIRNGTSRTRIDMETFFIVFLVEVGENNITYPKSQLIFCDNWSDPQKQPEAGGMAYAWYKYLSRMIDTCD